MSSKDKVRLISRDQSTRRRRDQKLGYYARNADRINREKRQRYQEAKRLSLDHSSTRPDFSLDQRTLARELREIVSKLRD